MGPESEIQGAIVELLRAAGWLVVVFSTNRQVRRAMAGFPDVFAAKADHVLLIETKSETGKLRPSQVRFLADVERHLGVHVRYVVPRSVEDVVGVLGEVGV